jgi:hypothetical protein
MILGYSLNMANPWQSEILIAAIASVWMSDFSCPFLRGVDNCSVSSREACQTTKTPDFPGFPIHYPWQ